MSEEKHRLLDKHIQIFGLCGCVGEEPIVDLAVKLLKDFRREFKEIDGDDEPVEKRWKKRFIDFEEDPIKYYLVTHLLEEANLIEHGTSVRFPWLTSLGEEWLSDYENIVDQK